MSAPTVFISYSHKDEEWKDRLVTHLRVLQMEHILDVWDDRRIGAGDDWYPEILDAMGRASVAILMVSADFLTSEFILGEEVPHLLQRREKEGLRVFPVIVKPCAWKRVKWLARMQVRPKDGRPLSAGDEHQIDADLSAIAEEIADMMGRAAKETAPEGYVPIAPEKISLAKLPSTNPDLFGRDKELAMLDAAWGNDSTNVVSLVAFGGVGKTALVSKWLLQMGADKYRGAERVYGYSFYSQGAAEGRQASADPFIAAALGWFGDPDPTAGSPWDKGERLAELIRKHRTLLILDGLEPLQYPPGEMEGRLKDPGLQSLLQELARHNPGMCIVTTRLKVDDIKHCLGMSVEHINLENLSPEAGAELLKSLGVEGTDDELGEAVGEFGGHALALTLLGSLLKEAYDGDIRCRREIGPLEEEMGGGGHARRVMESYERWLGEGTELSILRLMGLFDRPAEGGALAELRKAPVIPGLTDALFHQEEGFSVRDLFLSKKQEPLSDRDWDRAVMKLRHARLLLEKDISQPGTLDAHPLVREHFGEKLKESNPDAWKEAHSRLYEYYKSQSKESPDTVEDIAVLFAASAHCCQAGRHQEAYDEYRERICRDNDYFKTFKLCAFGLELAALSYFFDPPWCEPVTALTEDAKVAVLNLAGFRLQALGRLAEAAQTMQAGLETLVSRENWEKAALAAEALSEIHLTIGDLVRALGCARQSVDLAEHSGDAFTRVHTRTALADVLHQAGILQEAEATFHEAEAMQKSRQPGQPILHSVQGFRYCDLLLGQGKYREVQIRSSQAIEIAMPDSWLLDIALNYLSLGRSHLLSGQQAGTIDLVQAEVYLEQAVDGLRQAGMQQYLPLALLARAQLHRARGESERAERDLGEAMTIATRGGMGLHQADCHLEYARLYLAMDEKSKAQESLAAAREMIGRMGYHRRDGEVEALEG
jgi:tetratricopeptide (TPR) repeat protein